MGWAVELIVINFTHSELLFVNSGYVCLLEDICKYMCEKSCGIWANIAAQIASEALRIRAHRHAVEIKLLTKYKIP